MHRIIRTGAFIAGVIIAAPAFADDLLSASGLPSETNSGDHCFKFKIAGPNGGSFAIDMGKSAAGTQSTKVMLREALGKPINVLYEPSDVPSCISEHQFSKVVDVN